MVIGAGAQSGECLAFATRLLIGFTRLLLLLLQEGQKLLQRAQACLQRLQRALALYPLHRREMHRRQLLTVLANLLDRALMLHAPPDCLAQRTQRNLLARLTIAQHSL